MWDGTADVGAVVKVLVNGTVESEFTVLSDLNTVTINMTGISELPPEDPDGGEPGDPNTSPGDGGGQTPTTPDEPDTPTDPNTPTDPGNNDVPAGPGVSDDSDQDGNGENPGNTQTQPQG